MPSSCPAQVHGRTERVGASRGPSLALQECPTRAARRRHGRLRRRRRFVPRSTYTTRLDEREEGGTPSIIGDLRAGVAFLLKGDGWAEGDPRARDRRRGARPRAPVAASQSDRPTGRPASPASRSSRFNVAGLHHDFVSTLLDHLFGIQETAPAARAQGPTDIASSVSNPR